MSVVNPPHGVAVAGEGLPDLLLSSLVLLRLARTEPAALLSELWAVAVEVVDNHLSMHASFRS